MISMILFGLNTETAMICSCSGQQSVERAYEVADLVAVGRVVALETEFIIDSASIKEFMKLGLPADKIDNRLKGQYLRKVSVKVKKIYKGQSPDNTLMIYTGMGGGDCGFRFQEGQKYIIYGDKDSYFLGFFRGRKYPDGSGVYWTDICMRTQKYYRKEKKDIKKIIAQHSKD